MSWLTDLMTHAAMHASSICLRGAGALGLEALSRGAEFVHFVDSSRAAIQQVKANARQVNGQYSATQDRAQASFKVLRSPSISSFLIRLMMPDYSIKPCGACREELAQRWVSLYPNVHKTGT